MAPQEALPLLWRGVGANSWYIREFETLTAVGFPMDLLRSCRVRLIRESTLVPVPLESIAACRGLIYWD